VLSECVICYFNTFVYEVIAYPIKPTSGAQTTVFRNISSHYAYFDHIGSLWFQG